MSHQHPVFRFAPPIRLLSLVFALAAAAPLPAQTIDDSLAALQQALSSPAAKIDNSGASARAIGALSAITDSIHRGRTSEAQQELTALRVILTAQNGRAVPLVDQLLEQLRTQLAEAESKRNAALDEIARDAADKLSTGAKAEDFDPLLRRLATLSPAPAEYQYNSPPDQKLETVRLFVARCQDFVLQSTQDNPDQLYNISNDLARLATSLPVVSRSKLLELQAGLASRAAGSAAASTDRFEAMKKKVEATIDSAKSAADFDPLLVELTKPLPAATNRGGYNSVANQFEMLRRFTTRWQDYFSEFEAGDGAAAQNTLRELANDQNAEGFYPRSRILARLNGTAAARTHPAPAADAGATGPLLPPAELTVDTLDKFAGQLALRQAAGGYRTDPGLGDLLNETRSLSAAAVQLELGNLKPAINLGRLQNNTAGTGGYALPLGRIEEALVLQALPAYIQAPGDLKPSSLESPDRYLERVVKYGRAHADWQLVYRAINAVQALSQGYSSAAENADSASYRIFFTGLNLERAGQWTAAARSFLSALRLGGENTPAEEIGRHLQKLKADHPQEFETAQNSPEYPDAARNYMPAGLLGARNPAYPPMAGTRISLPPPTPESATTLEVTPAARAPAKPPGATPAEIKK